MQVASAVVSVYIFWACQAGGARLARMLCTHVLTSVWACTSVRQAVGFGCCTVLMIWSCKSQACLFLLQVSSS